MNEKYNSENKAEKFIEAILDARTSLDESKLTREKYTLVKKIKESFDMDKFLSSPISNYKVFASIHKLFEAKKYDRVDIKDAFDSKYTIVEHISSTPIQSKTEKKDKIIESYKKQENDLRLLTQKILIESFNKKYTTLNDDQKSLLKEYINNVTNTSNFQTYYSKQLKDVITELHSLYNDIDDKVTKIKLKETINVLKKQKIGRKISDNQVSSLMISYELIKEIKNVRSDK